MEIARNPHGFFIVETPSEIDNIGEGETMAYKEYNNNPYGKRTGDGLIRAISTALQEDWDTVYYELMLEGFGLKDVFTEAYVWGSYLYRNGFNRHIKDEKCPKYYTVRNFADDNPKGTYVVCTGEDVVTVIDGYYYDIYDCGDKAVVYYWKREVI